MDRIKQIVGKELPVDQVSGHLYFAALALHAPVVGAMHVHCADEAEFDSANTFHNGFADRLLPSLKISHRAAFRVANLGGRYEWGAVRIAEEHFTTPRSEATHKVLLVKVNAHVGVQEGRAEDRFGNLNRYETMSTCCGAISALLDGGNQPFVQELREMFLSENRNRIGILKDGVRIEPRLRSLYAALVSACLQARRVMLDIHDYQPASPTLFLVVPCVTINRHKRDTEIVCGYYTADRRGGPQKDEYFGLGDDPGKYQICHKLGRYEVEDGSRAAPRAARNHRRVVWEKWRSASTGPIIKVKDARLERVRNDVVQGRHHDHLQAKALLKIALPVLAEIAPVPAALFMFAEGVASIYHVYRAHRLAHQVSGSAEAQAILDEIHGKIDSLPPDKARALVETLVNEFRN